MTSLIYLPRTEYLNSITVLNTRDMAAKALRYWTMFLKSKQTEEANHINELKVIQRDPEFYLELNEFVQYMTKQGPKFED